MTLSLDARFGLGRRGVALVPLARLALLHLRRIADVLSSGGRDPDPVVACGRAAGAVRPVTFDENDQRTDVVGVGVRATDELDQSSHRLPSPHPEVSPPCLWLFCRFVDVTWIAWRHLKPEG